MTTRRAFISTLAGGLLAVPLAAETQQAEKIYRVGLLSPFSATEGTPWHQAFRQGLRDFGWVEGKNISIEVRFADGQSDRLPELAVELVRLNVDVIVTSVTPDALAAKNATRTIPIVMASPGDPVTTGLVASLARPGGNITGLSQMAPDLAGKRLELLKEIVPKLSRVAVLWSPGERNSTLSWNELQGPARTLGLQLRSAEVRRVDDLEGALDNARRARAGALAILTGPIFVTNQRRIAEFAVKNRLPSIFHLTAYVNVGGLVAYGPDRSDLFRRAAGYVDKILKGTKPADLPIERPTKFELALNLKTAKALGLTLPPSLLLRADRVIE